MKKQKALIVKRTISPLFFLIMILIVCITTIGCGRSDADGTSNINESDANNEMIITEYMHLSFDDTCQCFKNLQENDYSSIWEEEFLGWMKEMHDTYGAVFSIYVFNEEFTEYANSDEASMYADEFLEAKDWLKFGLHSPKNDQNANFGTNKGTAYSSYEVGFDQWNTFVDNVIKATGSHLTIDRMPRLHNCAGTEDALLGMRDANYGALGFLGVDDTRDVYYLENYEVGKSVWLFENDYLTDYKYGLVFIATDIRAEYLSYAGNGIYTYEDMTKELEYRYSDSSMSNSTGAMIIFSHENRIQNNLDNVKEAMEAACIYANINKIPFAFPQDCSYQPTSQDIYP